MKTRKLENKFFLNKEKIVNLNAQQMNNIKAGVLVTRINCPAGPSEPAKPSDACFIR